MKKRTTHIIVKLEIHDGEREYHMDLLCFVRDNETPAQSAQRNLKEFYSDGKKVRGEANTYEYWGGEVMTTLNGFTKVEEKDVPVLTKYFLTI